MVTGVIITAGGDIALLVKVDGLSSSAWNY
jgi:hypothetical protein